jgi:hypothetical protein
MSLLLLQILPFHVLSNFIRFSISFVSLDPLENLWPTKGIGFTSTDDVFEAG